MTKTQIMVVGFCVAVGLAACGGDTGQAPSDEAADTAEDTTDAPAEDTTDAPADDTASDEDAGAVVTVGSTDLGEVLVDGEGLTLYLFEPDEQGGSTCYDACATNWPPLVTDGDVEAGAGADADKLGTTERTDGSTQVTYDGWPLYRWAQDEAPGDTNGQGINDVWWMVGPDGHALTGESD